MFRNVLLPKKRSCDPHLVSITRRSGRGESDVSQLCKPGTGGSDSVKGGFNKSRKFVTDVSEELQIGPLKHRVAMVVYSGLSYRREIFPWNFAKNNEEFVRITNGLRAIGGTTNTKKALEVAEQLMSQRNRTIPSLVMVVTDGRSADDPKSVGERLQREANTWVFAAATGDPEKVDKTERSSKALQGAKIPECVVHRTRVAGGGDTVLLFTNVMTSSCAFQARTARHHRQRCELDLVLVIDFSTTTDPLIKFYKEMSQKLVSALKIGPHHTQVAVVTFATVGKTRTKFNLKQYKTQQEVLNAINHLESTGGTTAIGAGIQEGTKQSQEREGARPGIATKVMIVFTDGWSNKGPEPEQAARNAVAQGFELYSVSYTGKVENAVTINDYTLEVIAQDAQHKFTDKNFDQLIERVRRRNLPCL
ncbi:von Willebrand factor type A domain protein [Ancylostoma ceylanicum]|uniref:von Willebrand factor type A domain protein n=1 Tax=Ancylostoma ceylanicum TaxID=53326 RepID=A0A0D6L9K2_9BILA|nr:von Willebrand factor type A domain protein [Ancylostoma ceylanicum]